MNPTWTPGDKLHEHRQAFLWHPSQCTRGQTTDNSFPGTPLSVPGDRRQTILPLAPLSVYQGTDDRQFFPWHPSQCTRGQTTDNPSPGTPLSVPGDRRQTILPLAPFSVYQGKMTNIPLVSLSVYQGTDDKQSFSYLALLSVYHGTDDRRTFPWYPSQSTKGQTAPGT